MRARRWVARVVAVLLPLCAALCASGTTVAQATVTSFGTEGEGPGQLSSEPVGVAIDQESGDVYVADREADRVDKFGPEGEFMLAWGWGVVDREERLQTCTSTCFAGIPGAGSGQVAAPSGVAVDNDPLSPSHGDVYVADTNNARVEKFDADGAFLWTIGGEVNKTKDEAPGATQAEKDLCTAASKDECQGGTAGTEHGEFELETGNVVAVDPSGTLYVGDSGEVQEFSEGGTFKAEIELPGAGSTEALAVNAGTGVYVRSANLTGVREYQACATTCLGKELGDPRDPSGQPVALAIGSAGELFVTDGTEAGHHILEYAAGGHEIASFDTGTPAGRGLGFGEKQKRLYVSAPGEIRLTEPPPSGPVVIGESTEDAAPTTETLVANVNPEGHEESGSEQVRYYFEYGETEALGSTTEDEAVSTGSFEDREVSAPITGLKPRTSYYFRVVVSNAADEATVGPVETFTTLPPALVGGESASQVTATSARLAAEVDPLGRVTHYRFEYGRSTTYEESSSVPEGVAGAGNASVPLEILIEGLAPGTTYHYRIVASNELGESDGSDHTFTTQGTGPPAMLDGRAWEMVSPPDKRGVSLELSTEEGGLIQAAEDGSELTYFAEAPIDEHPKGNRSFAYTQLLSQREAGGWRTQDLDTPQESIEGLDASQLAEYKLFSADLSMGLVEPFGATPLSPTATERTPYFREDASEEYVPLLSATDVAAGVRFGGRLVAPGLGYEEGAEFVTATPSFGEVLLISPAALTGGFESFDNNSVFELAGEKLELVSVLPDGVPAAQEGIVAAVGAGNRGVRDAISTDGSRVVFGTEGGGEPHLYLRDMSTQETVQLDAPAAGAKNPGEGRPVYLDASDDDSKVFFVDEKRLTPGSTATSGEPDLYMCEIAQIADKLTCNLKDLTSPLNANEHADVLGADIGTDETGTYIYFVANGALTAGAERGDCGGSSVGSLAEPTASCNLYVHDTTSGETRLIAVLSNRDAPDWQAGFEERDNYSQLTSRVSPNGRYLAFMSQRSLTGYDNRDAHSGQPDEEVFLYDFDTSALSCVSCNPTGARPVGVADPNTSALAAPPPLLVDRPDTWGEQTLAGSIPGWPKVDDFHALYEPRNLADDGRLFFDSADGLVPQDTNEKEDVYEYEPGGVGSCTTASGCVGLVSSGTSGEESAFVDASLGGEDVFFMTAAKLAPNDVDGALDIYDARVCTGAALCPGAPPSVPLPCASAESCRPALPPQFLFGGSAPTASVSRSGNVPPSPLTKATPTRAQKLAKALKACKRDRKKAKRKACEAQARRRYATKAVKKARRKTK